MSAPRGLSDYRLLGRSGLRVAPLCMGAMSFGGPDCDEAQSRGLFDLYAEMGGNFIDTAPGYARGASEAIIGRALASRRDRFVLATKFSFIGGSGRAELGGNSRKAIVKGLEASLKRLGSDYIDLYVLHAWEGLTPIEEVLRALDDLVSAGKILYAAADQTPAWKIAEGNTLARLNGLTPFIAYEGPYNLTERTAERELVPMASELGLSFMAHSPLGGGLLTCKHAQGASVEASGARTDFLRQAGALAARNLLIVDVLSDVAAECGCSPAQAALGWLLSRPSRPIPVLGVRTINQLRDNLGCLNLVLPSEQLARLDAASEIELGHPHAMLAKPFVQQGMVGAGFTVEGRAVI